MGCSPLPTAPSPEAWSRWEARRQQLESNLKNWAITGRIGVQQEDQGWHAALRWEQLDDYYRLQVSGPAGQGAARLEGGPTGVVLRRGDGVTYQADSPEQLLETHLGWQVPLAGLRDWVRGLPAPGELSHLALDEQGRLLGGRQDGWTFVLSNYGEVSGMQLPGRLLLEHPPLQVKLVIERWQLNHSTMPKGLSKF